MNKTIVLVEDDKILSDMYQLKFEKAGFTVASFNDGKKTLEWLKSHTADIALIDILLPQMNGLQLIKTIRINPSYSAMKIIILTNLSQSDVNLHETVRESLKVDAYYVKSQISPSQLVAHITALLQ
ncbi:response regulator [Candidatus Saccharibacteria bacterium]|nr:response regulator [Candidatus Saccharibacteria bacterium]